MPDAILNDVSDTALWVAVYRDKESQRPDALFRDPLAGLLVGDRGRQIEKQMSTSIYTDWSVVIRTCIIDSYIERLISEGVDTIINLGCGVDTRPYRLSLPATLRWIEVDFPHMIELKNTRLAREKPKCHLERVGMDLSNDEERQKLFSKLNSESKKVLILTEGVAPYLSETSVASLADDLRRQSHFCFWIIDYFSPQLMKYMNSSRRKKEMRNAPFVFNPVDWFAFFAEHGWQKREIRYVGEESEKLGRAMPLPWLARFFKFIFGAKVTDRFKRFSAYVLLEPTP